MRTMRLGGRFSEMAVQAFSGSRVVRTDGAQRKGKTFLRDAVLDADFCFAAGRRVGLSPGATDKLLWLKTSQLSEVGLRIQGDECVAVQGVG